MATTCVQTSITNEPAIGYSGQVADDGDADDRSRTNESATTIIAGIAVLHGTNPQGARPILSTDEPAVDVDSIVTTHASTTTKLILATTDLNGAIGQGEIFPPRQVTITLNSHSDWNDTVATVRGLDFRGTPISEPLVVPEGGAVTLTTKQFFAYVTEVVIPAATGTNGSFTVGTNIVMGPIDAKFAGVSIYSNAIEGDDGGFVQHKSFRARRRGRVKVHSESTTTVGGKVYVRVIATGDEVRGQLRGTVDSTDLAELQGARWDSARTGAGIAWIQLDPAF